MVLKRILRLTPELDSFFTGGGASRGDIKPGDREEDRGPGPVEAEQPDEAQDREEGTDPDGEERPLRLLE